MLRFLLIANKQGRPRLVRYYTPPSGSQRQPPGALAQQEDVIRRCLGRREGQCNFFDYKDFKIVYRKYVTLFFIAGIDNDENELAVLEFMQNIVETLDKYFDKVCEMDIMFSMDRVHMILDEMILNGRIIESNQSRILTPLQVMDHVVKR